MKETWERSTGLDGRRIRIGRKRDLFIKHDEQRKVANEMKYKEVRKVEEIAVMLEHGAKHGAIWHEG